MIAALHIALYVLAALGALTLARHAPVVHQRIAAKQHAAVMRRIISLELTTGVGLSADTREWIDTQPKPEGAGRTDPRPRHAHRKQRRMTVAALYVETGGVYFGLPDVDPWDEARDARLYAGPWPVVAHPPCARWSRTAALTEAWFGYKRGDDGGCFEAALAAVRAFGGVLEHPAYSSAWARFGLPRPIHYGGWTQSLLDEGSACYVEQERYGLASKKPTWIYAYGVKLPELRWGMIPDSEGTSPRDPGGGGMHAFRDRHPKGYPASRTPEAFRDVLLDMARSAAKVPA